MSMDEQILSGSRTRSFSAANTGHAPPPTFHPHNVSVVDLNVTLQSPPSSIGFARIFRSKILYVFVSAPKSSDVFITAVISVPVPCISHDVSRLLLNILNDTSFLRGPLFSDT
jgi:hypothetical protein